MADIVTTRIFQDGEKNITAVKMNDIIGSSVIQPAFVSAKPSTSTVASTDNFLVLQTAGTYAKAPFQTVIDSVNASLNTDSAIWNVRLRSFNAAGNSTFEVDQRSTGNTVSAANGLVIDRWGVSKVGTMVVSAGQNSAAAGVNVPGTSFAITRSFFRTTLTTQETSLGAGDYLILSHVVEGPNWRELQNDVHSLQVLVRSSVANLAIGVRLQNAGGTYTLTNLLTLGAANTWVLLTLPAMPIWPGAGNFVSTSGSLAYTIVITLACGSTYMSPANSTWQNGNFIGAVGQSNFAASPVNSTFDIAYISHEPGAVCSNPPMDCPFTDNLDTCQRYFAKSYAYGQIAASSTYAGESAFIALATNLSAGRLSFPKRMAKTPTLTLISPLSGTPGVVLSHAQNADIGGIGTSGTLNDAGFDLISTTGSWTGPPNAVRFHYYSDTGW